MMKLMIDLCQNIKQLQRYLKLKHIDIIQFLANDLHKKFSKSLQKESDASLC